MVEFDFQLLFEIFRGCAQLLVDIVHDGRRRVDSIRGDLKALWIAMFETTTKVNEDTDEINVCHRCHFQLFIPAI